MKNLLQAKYDIKWDNIDILREAILQLNDQFTNEDHTHQITMAATELMENACKYGAVGPVLVDLSKDEDNTQIYISFKNIANRDQIEKFKSIYNEIILDDAEAAYQKMAMLAMDNEDESQLGLARIRYELNCAINYNTDNDLTIILGNNQYQENDWLVLEVNLVIPYNS
jgi:hypothetical protein